MLKFILFLVIGWIILKIFKRVKFIRKSNVTTPEKKSKLKYNKGDIEDADFKDLD